MLVLVILNTKIAIKRIIRSITARSERSKTELQQEIDELQEQLGHQVSRDR